MIRIAETHNSIVPLQGDLQGSPAGDDYAAVFSELQAICGKSGCIAITSPGRGEGKSTIAANLALAIAAQHRSVLLIDFAFRRPALQAIMGSSPLTYDVSDALQRADRLSSAICSRSDISLHLAPLKSPIKRYVASQSAATVLQAALLHYTWVIVDCEPLSESKNFSTTVDSFNAIALVVRERSTPVKALTKAWHRCPAAKTLVCLNRHEK